MNAEEADMESIPKMREHADPLEDRAKHSQWASRSTPNRLPSGRPVSSVLHAQRPLPETNGSAGAASPNRHGKVRRALLTFQRFRARAPLQAATVNVESQRARCPRSYRRPSYYSTQNMPAASPTRPYEPPVRPVPIAKPGVLVVERRARQHRLGARVRS